MTEIEQLRADIKVMDSVSGEMKRLMTVRQYDQFTEINHAAHERLAKLEAEAAEKADPWREHKEVLSGRFHTQQGADHDEKLVLNYAMHLQQTNEKLAFKARLDAARIAELEAELARTKEAHETVGEAYDCKREDNKDLRRTVKELQAELANRPVVYCMKNNLTGIYGKHFGLDRIALFDIENPEVLAEWHPEPYTGEQS